MDKKINIDTRTIITFWLVPLGIVLAGLFISHALTGLIILGLALFIALAISPLVSAISRRIPSRSRNFATAVAYVVVVGTLTLILAIIVPVIIGETSRLVSSLPDTLKSDSDLWYNLNNFGQSFGINDLRAQILSFVSSFANSFDIGGVILSGVGAIGTTLAGFVLVLVLAFLIHGGITRELELGVVCPENIPARHSVYDHVIINRI